MKGMGQLLYQILESSILEISLGLKAVIINLAQVGQVASRHVEEHASLPKLMMAPNRQLRLVTH